MAPYVCLITGHTEPRQGTPEESRNSGFWADDSQIFFENATGNLVHLLNVCHPGRFSLSFPHPRGFTALFVTVISVSTHLSVCCSFRTFIGFLGMDCNVWDQKNFLATFLFQKIAISSTQSVLPVFKLKKSEYPRTRLVPRGVSQNFGNFKSCDISLFHKLLTIEKFPNFYFQ